MSKFDQLMKAFQQQDAKLNKLMQALPEIVDLHACCEASLTRPVHQK